VLESERKSLMSLIGMSYASEMEWRCHICGALTLKQMRGTTHLLAPEIDHVVPLARGGEHTYANTACAHRRCNQAKGARLLLRHTSEPWAAPLNA
jgi:5-methylcytosine-specific restriction endonuclease McrA